MRGDLCGEAMRMGRVLCELLPREAENIGLLSLMLLQNSRRDARMVDGVLVTLEDQDRSRWDHAAIAEGLVLVEQALRLGDAGPYQLQAAVAALHCQARTASDTDWPQIAALYRELLVWNPSPVIALNHAVAVAMSDGAAEGLRRIANLGAVVELDHDYLFQSSRAALLRR